MYEKLDFEVDKNPHKLFRMLDGFLKSGPMGRQVKYLGISGGDLGLPVLLQLLSKLTPNLTSFTWDNLNQRSRMNIFNKINLSALRNGWSHFQDVRLSGDRVEQILIGLYLIPSINLSSLTTLYIQITENVDPYPNLTTQLAQKIMKTASALNCLTLENGTVEIKDLEVLHVNAPNLKEINLVYVGGVRRSIVRSNNRNAIVGTHLDQFKLKLNPPSRLLSREERGASLVPWIHYIGENTVMLK